MKTTQKGRNDTCHISHFQYSFFPTPIKQSFYFLENMIQHLLKKTDKNTKNLLFSFYFFKYNFFFFLSFFSLSFFLSFSFSSCLFSFVHFIACVSMCVPQLLSVHLSLVVSISFQSLSLSSFTHSMYTNKTVTCFIELDSCYTIFANILAKVCEKMALSVHPTSQNKNFTDLLLGQDHNSFQLNA